MTDNLDERLKAAGMLTVDQMLQPINRFAVHAGMTSLEAYEQWLERKAREYTMMQMGYELGDKEKDDDMYEWVLGHAATFKEALVNFRAAKQGKQ